MKQRRASNLLPSARRRGLILVVVVWLIVMLSFIAYALAYDMRIGIRMTSESKKSLQALGLARIGMAKAVMDLRNDRFMSVFSPAHQNDTTDDDWARTEDKTSVAIKEKDGDGYWTVRVVDVNRRLDINSLNPNNYEALVYLLTEVCKMNKDDAENIALCTVDYIDADTDAGIMKGEKLGEDEDGGGETDAYTEWAQTLGGDRPAGDWKFHARNDAMLNIEELLEIPGITKDILYGDPSETSRDPIDRMDDKKASTALVDYVCAGMNKGVNLNTAPEEVIAAMLYGASHGADDVDSIAAEIVEVRNSAMKATDEGPEGIRDFGELAVAGVNPTQLEQMRNMFRLRLNSSEFDIISRGVYRGYKRTIAVTASVDLETFNVDPDNPETIGKRDTLADGETKQDSNLKVDPAVRIIRTWEI